VGIVMMRKGLAVVGMLSAWSLSATPCANVESILTPLQKQAWAPVIARQLRVAQADVLQVLRLDHWRVIEVDSHRADNGFLFYRDDPLRSRYVTTWSGAARPNEEVAIAHWALVNVPGVPAELARCFAWQVSQHRDS
jgi:hypothetical protein